MRKSRAAFLALLLAGLLSGRNVSGQSFKSFAGFAYFVDKLEFPAKKIGRVWATPLSVYEGPFFTNDELHIYLPPHYFEEAHSPFFRGPVGTAASNIVYYNNYGPSDAAGRMDEKRAAMIFQSDVRTGAAEIPLPARPYEEARTAAFGGSFPRRIPYIFLPHDRSNRLTGGIVVNGPLSALTFRASPGENFRMVLQELKKTAIVEVDYAGGATVVESPGEKPAVYSGIPNGAVYVAGSLGAVSGAGGLSGTVKGRWTVASPRDMFITDSLLYSDTPAGSRPAGRDCLALIARSVFIAPAAPDILYLYATVFAAKQEGKEKLGTLFVLPDRKMAHMGELFWWGNYIGEYPAIMGRFDRATGESTDGYALHKFYDDRLAADPPPFFPSITLTSKSSPSQRPASSQ